MSNVTADGKAARSMGIEMPDAGMHSSASKNVRSVAKPEVLGTGYRTSDVALLGMFVAGQRKLYPGLLFVALLMTGLMAAHVHTLTSGLFSFVLLAILLWSRQCYIQFQNQNDDDIEFLSWNNIFVTNHFMTACACASCVFLLVPQLDSTLRAFVMLGVLSLLGAECLFCACLPLAFYAFMVPLLAAFSLLVLPSGVSIVVVSSSLFLFFTIMVTRRLHENTLSLLTFRAEKDILVAELEESKANSDEARRRAEEGNLAKSRFLATMSHELRTPLNAILGFSEVMNGELFGPHSVPAYKEYSRDIHSSGQHLLALINEILDLSRIEAGRYELNEEAVFLANIVDDCQHLLNMRAKNRNISVSRLVETALPRVMADERAMRQIILNLLSNAIKFTPVGGEIHIKIGWTVPGGQYVSIKDNGPGIPPEEIPIVLSSFGRGSLAQKNADEGSGLGLPIVKGLIEMHSGQFLLRSKVGQGTDVIVVLPASRVAGSNLAAGTPASSSMVDAFRKTARSPKSVSA